MSGAERRLGETFGHCRGGVGDPRRARATLGVLRDLLFKFSVLSRKEKGPARCAGPCQSRTFRQVSAASSRQGKQASQAQQAERGRLGDYHVQRGEEAMLAN